MFSLYVTLMLSLVTINVHGKIAIVGVGEYAGQLYTPGRGSVIKPDNFGLARQTSGIATCACAMGTNNRMYISGGQSESTSQFLSSIMEYDPRTDTSRQWANMTVARGSHAMTCVQERLFICGGTNSDSQLLSSCDVCTSERQCSPTTTMPHAAQWHSMYAVAQMLYVVGGLAIDSDYNMIYDQLLRYDTINGQWTRLTSLPTPAPFHPPTMGLYPTDGHPQLLVCTYTNVPNDVSPCAVYDVQSDIWTTAANLNVPRMMAGSGELNHKIYLLGGANDPANLLNSIEVYDNGNWTLLNEKLSQVAPMAYTAVGIE